jgi:hypothetical protein
MGMALLRLPAFLGQNRMGRENTGDFADDEFFGLEVKFSNQVDATLIIYPAPFIHPATQYLPCFDRGFLGKFNLASEFRHGFPPD